MRLSARYDQARFWIWFSFALLAFFVGNIIVAALTMPTFSIPKEPDALLESIFYLALIVVPLTLVIGIGRFFLVPRLKREVSAHEAYLNGASVPLIQPQPTLNEPDIEQLVIQWQGQRSANLLSLVFGLLVVCGIALLWFVQAHFPEEPVSSIVSVVIWIYGGALFLRMGIQQFRALALPGSHSAATPYLRADAEGLSLSPKQRIKWQDARIFARVGQHKRNPRLAYYELVDDKQSLTFAVALKPPSRFALVKPTTSFEEYERQTQQLLGMIAARTGLPLVDLRSH